MIMDSTAIAVAEKLWDLILSMADEVGCCEDRAIRLIDARLFADTLMSAVLRLSSQDQADVWSLLQREIASRRAPHS